jgi:hypothetical protein
MSPMTFPPFKERAVRRLYPHLTLIPGITRHALMPLDSGLYHLNDIWLAPQYAGICDFALEEFGTIFGDRMEDTLGSLNAIGEMALTASLDDLGEVILHLCDSYKWRGPTRDYTPRSFLFASRICHLMVTAK